jgi:flagellar basal body-associated protein FliL
VIGIAIAIVLLAVVGVVIVLLTARRTPAERTSDQEADEEG